AGLEADSVFWPVSKPVFRSLKLVWHVWAVFYVVTALLGLGVGMATWTLFLWSTLQMPLIAGPMWAAAVFIYGRLLGRLAWFILQKSNTPEQKKAARRIAEQEHWKI